MKNVQTEVDILHHRLTTLQNEHRAELKSLSKMIAREINTPLESRYNKRLSTSSATIGEIGGTHIALAGQQRAISPMITTHS